MNVRILFVCHGNICRSPMAEFVMKDMVEKRGIAGEFHIESAATTDEEIGNDTHHGTRKKLREEGVPFTRRSARRMVRGDYANFDYLIGMDKYNIADMKYISGGDPENKIHLMLDFTYRHGESVADPWYTGDFDKTYDDILAGCGTACEK